MNEPKKTILTWTNITDSKLIRIGLILSSILLFVYSTDIILTYLSGYSGFYYNMYFPFKFSEMCFITNGGLSFNLNSVIFPATLIVLISIISISYTIITFRTVKPDSLVIINNSFELISDYKKVSLIQCSLNQIVSLSTGNRVFHVIIKIKLSNGSQIKIRINQMNYPLEKYYILTKSIEGDRISNPI